MPNRTAKLLSAIFTGFLAGAVLSPVAHGEPPAADACLSGPKDPTPLGGHWYYRIDHATKRHCWHLGTEHEKLAQLGPNSANSAVAPNAETALQPSVADAHAELPGQRGVRPNHLDAQIPATAANAGSGEDNSGARTPGAEMLPSAIASRWPDPTGANAPSSSGPAAGNPSTAMPSNATAALPLAPAAATLAAADPSSEQQSGPLGMLAIAIIGALSLAGLMAAAIFRFGGARRSGRRQIPGDRRPVRDWPGAVRRSPPLNPNSTPRRPLAPGDDPNARIAAMLTRLARSTPR